MGSGGSSVRRRATGGGARGGVGWLSGRLGGFAFLGLMCWVGGRLVAAGGAFLCVVVAATLWLGVTCCLQEPDRVAPASCATGWTALARTAATSSAFWVSTLT